jgi:hypothetical protein
LAADKVEPLFFLVCVCWVGCVVVDGGGSFGSLAVFLFRFSFLLFLLSERRTTPRCAHLCGGFLVLVLVSANDNDNGTDTDTDTDTVSTPTPTASQRPTPTPTPLGEATQHACPVFPRSCTTDQPTTNSLRQHLIPPIWMLVNCIGTKWSAQPLARRLCPCTTRPAPPNAPKRNATQRFLKPPPPVSVVFPTRAPLQLAVLSFGQKHTSGRCVFPGDWAGSVRVVSAACMFVWG